MNRLERELVADVDLCRWFDRLAGDEPQAAPGRRNTARRCSVGWLPRSSRPGTSGVITSVIFAALLLGGAALTIAAGVLHLPAPAMAAMIVFTLAPMSVFVARGSRRSRGSVAPRRSRPGRPPAGRSGVEGGMWLLP